MTTGKTTALSIWTFVGKVMSLLCNKLYRFVSPLPGLSIVFCPLVKGAKELCGLFISALIPFTKAPPSWPYHLSEVPPLNTIILGVRISTYRSGRGRDRHKHSVYTNESREVPRMQSLRRHPLSRLSPHLCYPESGATLKAVTPVRLTLGALPSFGPEGLLGESPAKSGLRDSITLKWRSHGEVTKVSNLGYRENNIADNMK